jgi:hypothetical protein
MLHMNDTDRQTVETTLVFHFNLQDGVVNVLMVLHISVGSLGEIQTVKCRPPSIIQVTI